MVAERTEPRLFVFTREGRWAWIYEEDSMRLASNDDFDSAEAALNGHGGDSEERGLHFICLCANLVRQFEFVQNAWISVAKFDGLFGEADPLLGNREPIAGGIDTDQFSMPQASGVTKRLEGLPPFVRVRGGAYFFMPGIRALRFIASRGS